MVSVVLYSFRRCPYAMRARMALLVSGAAFEIREIKLSAKPPQMIEASPKGTVPVLVLPDGAVIEESLDIMRWALVRHDPERWLDGEDRALIDANDGPFKFHLDRYKYPQRYGSNASHHRAAALDLLTPLETRLCHQPYLCGPTRAFTDAALMPFVRQFAATDPDWFGDQHLPGIQRWLTDQTASPLFGQIMVRLKAWQPA
ncbi:glutathione S-transferase [Sphingomonas vulcanisoli]|uniref:Glutathione S-transferase n=1 Tax=Sphingomonas vulcanisoli TaxID=1658060 RepID=A0ABX0TPL6_9SPHN|nr:glutathione S-transferase [Sphingomonas vulcanisoli]NIJ06704.1 glutathione S-transferase [Sphingomonas vulcanisoli]